MKSHHFHEKVSYLISVAVGALVLEFLAPPANQILTISEHLCKVPRDTDQILLATPQIDVSSWWRSHKLIGAGCKVKVRNQGHITD